MGEGCDSASGESRDAPVGCVGGRREWRCLCEVVAALRTSVPVFPNLSPCLPWPRKQVTGQVISAQVEQCF